MDLELLLAGSDQVNQVTGLLSAAARWMTDAGIEQWPCPFPREIVEASVSRGETHLALLAGELIGSVALLEQDAAWWGPQPPDALYLHRLVVAPEVRGKGIGEQILEWAQDQTVASGREWLRLDCGAGNTRLRRYYERQGFRHVDDVMVDLPGAGRDGDMWYGSLYQLSCER